MSAQAFAIGDHVAIVAAAHPWKGHTGVIIGPFAHPLLDWTVRLDSGSYGDQACAAASSELRLASGREQT